MAPAITITSEELRERVEEHLGHWIPDSLWERSEPYARRKLDLCRERSPEIDYYNDEYLVLLTADTVRAENLCTRKAGYARRASGMLFPSEELPPAGGGSSPYPRRMGKRVDTYGFYPLDSRFPLFLNLTQTRDRRPPRNGERQRSFSTVGAHSVRPFLYLYAVSDTILLHISATPRRRDIPVSRNSFIWILRTAPANFICPCYSFVHMVGENESQNEKMETETISFSIFHFQLLTDPQPESQTHPFHPDASDNALSLPRSRRRAAAQRSGSGWP